jgi:hypothetical protein
VRHSIRCFPADDEVFAAAVAEAAAEFDSPDVQGHSALRNDPARSVEQLLRRTYPRARVVRMDDLAAIDPDTVELYAFRDGAMTPDILSS